VIQKTNDDRLRAVEDFVRAGGTLVCFNRSTTFAIDNLKLPSETSSPACANTEFFVGGSLLNVVTDPTHRVMAETVPRHASAGRGGSIGTSGTQLRAEGDEFLLEGGGGVGCRGGGGGGGPECSRAATLVDTGESRTAHRADPGFLQGVAET
jgi:hypothetical protein